jgi:hypothetical protein
LGITLARESAADIWDEALPLASAHHAEVGPLPQQDFKLNRKNWDVLESIHLLRVYTARNESGDLVGYCTMVVSPTHGMYADMLWVMQDTLYVRPDHRNYMVLRFLKYQDLSLKLEGAQAIYRHAPLTSNLGKLLLHMSYRLNDRGYVRDLREAA